jgi:hypothetical protein
VPDDLTQWQTALVRLMTAPLLGAAQARFLVEALGVERPALLGFLIQRLADPNEDNAKDAAYVMEHVLDARDRATVEAYVASGAPAALRAWVRALYQNGLAHGRIKEEDAAVATPPDQVVALYVEEVVRPARRIPQPWQRARVAAESLVSDAPLPDDAAPQAVTALAVALHVPAVQVWAELLVHPLTRPSYRQAAEDALATPVAAAAPMFEMAHAALLPGPLKERAALEFARHQAASLGTALGVRVSAPDPRGAVVVTLQLHGARPSAVAVAAFPGMTSEDVVIRQGLECEEVHLWAASAAASAGGLWDVPPAAGLGLLAAACPWVLDAALLGKGKDGPRPQPDLKAAWGALANAVGLPLAGELPALPPADAVLDPLALNHVLALNVELTGMDLSESSRRELTKEMRARGRPRDDTAVTVCREVAGKKVVVARLRAGLDHIARLAALVGQGPAGAYAMMSAALGEPSAALGQAVLQALLRKTLGVVEASAGTALPVLSARDEVRDDLLPHGGPAKGIHVLAMDLAAAALDVSRGTPRALDGVEEDLAIGLCAEAGLLAARAVVDASSTAPEDVRLQDAAKAALKARAESLPSRQRRELSDAWLKAWNELLTRACRGACNQQCLSNLAEPRLHAAYALDHPRLNKPWP